MQNCVIVDANSTVHTSFHGYEPKLDSKGNDQRILHGLMNSLVDLTYKLPRIDSIYMIFDPQDGALYRKSLFPDYKANRPPSDPMLVEQNKAAQKILKEYMGIPIFNYPGFEADDAIGTLAKMKAKTHQVIIVSPDKDLAQLVDDNIILMRKFRTKTTKGYEFLNKKDVKESFGVHPEQIPDWLALVGDVADNLPGLDKVGEKTAAKILSTYPSIEHLLAFIHEMEESNLKNKVIQARDTLPFVKKLAQVVTNLPIEDELRKAEELSIKIKTHQNYTQNLIKLEKFFNWPEYWKDMFI